MDKSGVYHNGGSFSLKEHQILALSLDLSLPDFPLFDVLSLFLFLLDPDLPLELEL